MTSSTTGPTSGSSKLLVPAHIEWLSLIRYQVRLADEQSRMPMPLAALSINQMQDAVEALLNLIAEHHGIELRRRSDFDKLFDDVAATFPDLARHRAPMLALNNARVGFKHHGNVLGQTTIERHRGSAADFMAEATQVGLAQDFEAISMIAFVRDEQARGHLNAATVTWAAGDAVQALWQLRLAFDRVVRDYEMRKVWGRGTTWFSTEPPFRPPRFGNSFEDKAEAHIAEWIKAIDGRVKLMALGVDLLRYAFFDVHTPSVIYVASGDALMQPHDETLITPEVFTRCYRFVIDTSLRLGSEDYSVDAHAMRLAREGREREPS